MNKIQYYLWGLPVLLGLILLNINPDKPSEERVTLEDYQRAEQFLGANTSQLVYGMISNETWLDDGRLIYRTSIPGGNEYMLADPADGSKNRAFDHNRLAKNLSNVTGKELDPHDLSLRNFKIAQEDNLLSYDLQGKRYQTDLGSYRTTEIDQLRNENEHLSPDGRWAAYIKEHNLWVRNTETNEHLQLTNDGQEHYGYATNNAGWIRSEMPVLKWSPGSDKIATFRHDGRGVGEMYLYNTKVGHPDLEQWKYPLPGDSLIFRIERVVIHLDQEPRVVRLKMPPDPHRSTISDHVADWDGTFLDVQWSRDGKQLAFVSSSRNHQVAQLRVADPYTGEMQDVLREENDTYFESGYHEVSWRLLKETGEVIWFSERSNWGHLYLYDLQTGKLKHQITKGNWRVLNLLHVDPENRRIYFTGSNREEGNPYYHYLYRINMDGTGLVNLTPENRRHNILFSGSREYFLDTYSTPVVPPVSVIRNLEGNVVTKLEKADITALEEQGWVPPVPFRVKARDGKTDLYGLMYKPTRFDDAKKYPVLNYLYPGPQTGSVGSRSFRSSRSDKQSLAELGFIVVEVDALGTPGRSKSFHDAWYGKMGDNGIPDQIAMIRQLADRHPWMDTTRVGIWGHSGG
ncbi:MAG: DPP IV N-terminal domain-containing protein, partial [Balneolaceae bacterium]|nr:DPP IV N-terminal domain-containing protein [Balneolaceae bacterium]